MPSNSTVRTLSDDGAVTPYIDLVKVALAHVAPDYYQLPTTYSLAGVTRERIFCYELYHQIRLHMSPRHSLSLHGEIDKRGHRDFVKTDRANPDFVFHIPGTHAHNTLVMEVKGVIGPKYRRAIGKDFNTLLSFTSKYQYKAGIFILFGYTFDDLMHFFSKELTALRDQPGANTIHIFTVLPELPCEEHLLSDL